MGYLTTITFRNDSVHTFKDHKDELVDKIVEHCLSGGVGHKEYFSLGGHINPVVLQRPRHADDHTTYVHMGNTVVEMNPYSIETQEMCVRSPEFFNQVLKYMERQVKELKQLQKREGELCGTK
jgi:hypothetical protein